MEEAVLQKLLYKNGFTEAWFTDSYETGVDGTNISKLSEFPLVTRELADTQVHHVVV